MLTPGWEPEGPAQKNSQGVPWILLDISTAFFIPAAVSYMLGLYRNFIRRIPLLSNIKVLHALDSQSHGFLARRDFGTWNSSNRDFGRFVWMALCAIGFQIHRANAMGLSRNCTLPYICCPGPIDRKKHQQPRIATEWDPYYISYMSLKSLTCCDSLSCFVDQDLTAYLGPWNFIPIHPDSLDSLDSRGEWTSWWWVQSCIPWSSIQQPWTLGFQPFASVDANPDLFLQSLPQSNTKKLYIYIYINK